MPALALADRNGLYGVARFPHRGVRRPASRPTSARRSPFAPSATCSRRPPGCRTSMPSEPPRLLCSAPRKPAIRIFASSSRASRCAKTTKAEGAATLDDLEEFSAGLICLTGGDEGPLAAAVANHGNSTRPAKSPIASAPSTVPQSLSRTSAPSASATKNAATRRCSRSPLRSSARHRHQWRPLRHRERPRDARRAHHHPPPHYARQGRPLAYRQRRSARCAPPHAMLFSRYSRGHRQHAHRQPAPRVHPQQSRLRIPPLSRARRRNDGQLSRQARRRRASANAMAHPPSGIPARQGPRPG
jgi:hypothetical protein